MEVMVLGLAGLFCFFCAYFIIYFFVAVNSQRTYHFLHIRSVLARYFELFS